MEQLKGFPSEKMEKLDLLRTTILKIGFKFMRQYLRYFIIIPLLKA